MPESYRRSVAARRRFLESYAAFTGDSVLWISRFPVCAAQQNARRRAFACCRARAEEKQRRFGAIQITLQASEATRLAPRPH
jgi:hypothetical protein